VSQCRQKLILPAVSVLQLFFRFLPFRKVVDNALRTPENDRCAEMCGSDNHMLAAQEHRGVGSMGTAIPSTSERTDSANGAAVDFTEAGSMQSIAHPGHALA
jgi:hypothetical protein